MVIGTQSSYLLWYSHFAVEQATTYLRSLLSPWYSAESADPKKPFFWCIAFHADSASFYMDLCGMAWIPRHFTWIRGIYSEYSVLNLIQAD